MCVIICSHVYTILMYFNCLIFAPFENFQLKSKLKLELSEKNRVYYKKKCNAIIISFIFVYIIFVVETLLKLVFL